MQGKAWHRQAGEAVATLSTVDGIVFELAWFPTASWPTELGRVAVIPEDLALRESVGARDGRTSPTSWPTRPPRRCAARATTWSPCSRPGTRGEVLDADGAPLTEVETGRLLAAIAAEARGRLRVLAADVSGEETSVVGVVSWVLLADGWRALTPHRAGGERAGRRTQGRSRTTWPPTSPRCSRR